MMEEHDDLRDYIKMRPYLGGEHWGKPILPRIHGTQVYTMTLPGMRGKEAAGKTREK